MILPIILVLFIDLCSANGTNSVEESPQSVADFSGNRLDGSERVYQKVAIKRETNDTTGSGVSEGGVSGDVTPEVPQQPAHPPPTDICVETTIYTIDRMSNGTVRIYRDYYYWDLDGLPLNSTLSGPHPITWEDLAPVTKNTRIMTDGESKITFRFENKKFWAYSAEGTHFINGSDIALPDSLGGLFYDHKKPNPLMLCTRDITVFYFKFNKMKWEVDGEAGGYPMGRNGESIVPDLTTAFSIPDHKSYVVYLFKKDEYCRRPEKLKSGKSCDEWKKNKDLFGCQEIVPTVAGGVANPADSSDVAVKEESVAPGQGPVAGQDVTPKAGKSSSLPFLPLSYKCLAFILIITLLNFKSNL